MLETYDVIVVGAGPGGYPCAIRLAQLGMKVVVVDDQRSPDDEQQGTLGGTCANVGCVPSKALLAASLAYEQTLLGSAQFGIEVSPGAVKMNFEQVQKHRAQCVSGANQGVEFLFKKYGIERKFATARFLGKQGQLWQMQAGETCVAARHVVLACGSKSRALPFVQCDEVDILSNVGALKLDKAPRSLGIIGAGVIGLELGSVWRRFGSEVTLFDTSNRLLPMADHEIGAVAKKQFLQQGLQFQSEVKITNVQKIDAAVRVTYQDNQGSEHQKDFEKVLIAIGRVPCVEKLAPSVVGLKLDQRGWIDVDTLCRTNLSNVWAIGDTVRGVQLAHKAHQEGVAVAERIANKHYPETGRVVPSVIYTEPEIAWVGLTQEQAQQKGIEVKVGRCAFAVNARARAQHQTQGLVKVVVHAQTGRLLGAHIIGGCAAEMVAQACCCIEFGATAEDVAMVCYAHPSYSEAFKEACAMTCNLAIDI